ncbi:MAG: hypothetical protein J0I07_43800, partial [Myxococcales bacterium]|nr:hypothetical protein [Myxococcales bacterium]
MLLQVRRVHGSLLSAGLMGVLALTNVGCGGPDAKSPKALTVPNPFPTKDALESVARSPIKPRPARAVAAVPEWRVDTSDVPGSSPVEKLLVEHSAAAKDHTFTRELRCVARELGRFRAEHRAEPDERVQRFIVGACGSTSPSGVRLSCPLIRGSRFVTGPLSAKVGHVGQPDGSVRDARGGTTGQQDDRDPALRRVLLGPVDGERVDQQASQPRLLRG